MKISGKKLKRGFYLRPTLVVAEDLLGKTIIYRHPRGILAGDIVEVEAYIGEDDPACHAAPGPTERNAVMYKEGGHSYIYFIYGMYHCFNIVTERSGFPAAILVRAAEAVSGLDIMAVNSPKNKGKPANGPGKFCRAFGLSREQNGLDLTGDQLYLIDRSRVVEEIRTSPRIGIKKAVNLHWRYYDANSDCVSRK